MLVMLPIICFLSPLRAFEARLLFALGLMPDLTFDWQGNPINASQTYYLSGEGQLVLVGDVAGFTSCVVSASDLRSLNNILSQSGDHIRNFKGQKTAVGGVNCTAESGRNRVVKQL